MSRLLFKPRWLTALAAAALLTAPAWAGATPTHFMANLTPLNSSGVSGTANLTLNNNMLKVHITATGLEANMPHPQHIHGVFDSSGNPVDSTTPTAAVDNPANGGNGDGVIELGESATTYGPILIPLTSPPGGQVSDFPTAPNGTVDFTETYDLTNSGIYNDGYGESDVLPLSLREIALHGMITPVDITNDAMGLSFAAGDYDPLLPVASGEIVAMTAVPGPASIIVMVTGLGLMLGFLGLRRKHS